MRDRALTYLRTALGRADADFRPGQWESIQDLLSRRRLLVVERTGWGKSMVYFLATRLLRDSGAGVSLLISPLLSLMRNQLEAAGRIGVRAETINSTNPDNWGKIERELRDNRIDILLVSPERLANDKFRENVLAHISDRVGLFVVDEAHCISDWGHDFRPDYRRIVRVLQALPGNVPVLATTATANDRVVGDVISQLGRDIRLVRGPLVRESLKLQNITMASPAARMAWLARTIPSLPGSGIVYTLTQRDAERVAEWLRTNEIVAKAYHADVADEEAGASQREDLEQQLLKNKVKVLVATVALGMGFDKPDLGFVIHFQRPASVVHYYQQVGRAGRAVEEAFGILLHGEEDDSISDFFIRNAFPPQRHVDTILQELDQAEGGLSIHELEARLNLKHSQLEKAIKYLSVEMPSPITKIGSKWNVTAAAKTYRIDQAYVDAITGIRRQEQAQMQTYMAHSGCLMEFLARALDDPQAGRCGKCAGCKGEPLLSPEYDHDLANRAAIFLKRSHQPLPPRKQWPSGCALPIYGFTGRIGDTLCAQEGRALSLWRDAGWGQMVAAGKYEHGRLHDELVGACVEMIRQWNPTPSPEWVVSIPSLNRPELVPDFARRLASALGLPFQPCIRKMKANPPQKEMQNSFQQARNLDGIFVADPAAVPGGPCLLVDDITDSGWTFTVASAVLRQAGCAAVFPVALALNSPRMD
ncbi:MAG: RecQ family ATP-dependent DNA helicase [Lentisphaerae bacterium]|nr:RecQ family ATP-dependent DNA helicase [Lentisphaerota bacterium]